MSTAAARTYNLIIIGAGPAGYNAAERAAAAGLRTLLIEKQQLGGVCLNWGCIPTKTLIAAAKHYQIASTSADFGVRADNVTFEWTTAMARKARTVETLRAGITARLEHRGVTVISGEARFIAPRTLSVAAGTYSAERILIATGARPAVPPIPGASTALTSRQILELPQIPKTLAVIGGGVIGIEFASLFAALGTQVTVIEMLPEILPSIDPESAALLRRRLENRITFELAAQVTQITPNRIHYTPAPSAAAPARPAQSSSAASQAAVPAAPSPNPAAPAPSAASQAVAPSAPAPFRPAASPAAAPPLSDPSQAAHITAEAVLLAVGRTPVTAGLENLGLDINRGAVVVDEHMRTNLPGIWAAGDCTGLSLLAHSAYRMGEVAVNDILGRPDRMRLHAVPSVVYSLPEAAGVGITEHQARASGREAVTRKLPMQYSGRYLAEYGREPGFGKIVIDPRTRTLLGVHLVGGQCSETIWGAAALIEGEFRVQDIRELIFPHPTVAEIMREVTWEFE